MASASWDQIESLYERARAVRPGGRDAFLREHCDDPAIRKEVASLLDARAQAPRFFEEVAEGAIDPLLEEVDDSTEGGTFDPPDLTGEQVGSYRLGEQIGVGGMGLVYRAVRTDGDFERTVAVKLLRRRLYAEEAVRRFRAERQVLASLDHPNIAGLLDGGVTSGGRPYLVMEYVDGVPLTAYADAHDLGLDARLDLLQQVLEAVQAAHQQLVVHRDLKPSNVLVTDTEGTPRVTLLDFGIAKLLGDSLPVTRPQTRTGRHLMTPAYAAPEQVEGAEITTATDVYQLGALAYELMAGTRPFEVSGKSLTEIEQILLNTTPRKPSDAQKTGSGVASSEMQGDLDTITMKTLRKEPERRYRSVEALSADVQRYRVGTPIEARPATLGYRARKFASRNRTAVAAGLVVALLVAAYAVTVTIQAGQLAEQRDRAQREAEQAEAVSSFLVDLFEAADPERTGGDEVTAEDLLDQGSDRISSLDDQPRVQANLLQTLGQTHRRLGHLSEADTLLQRAVEQYRSLGATTSTRYAEAVSQLGLYRRDQGEYEDAQALLDDAIEHRREKGSPKALARELIRQSYVERQLGHLETARARIEEALEIQRRELGENHVATAESYFNLAAILREQGRLSDATEYQRRSLSILQSQVDGPHRGLAVNYGSLGQLAKKKGALAEAETYHQNALDQKRALYDAPHPAIAVSLQSLGALYNDMGRFDEAEQHLREALRMRRDLQGPKHPDIAGLLHNLGALYWDQGQLARADSVLREALAMKRTVYDPPHVKVALTLKQLALLRETQGRTEEAGARHRAAVAMYETVRPPEHPAIARARFAYGRFLLDQGRVDAARPVLRSAHHVLSDTPANPEATIQTALNYGQCLTRLGQYQKANAVLEEGRTLAETHGRQEALQEVQTALAAVEGK